MEWILEKLPVIVFVLVIIGQIVRAVAKGRGVKPDADEPVPTGDDDEQRRVREIQEQIRRRIAERRGHAAPAAEPPPLQPPRREPPPVARPETTQMPDPFGGPLRRLFEEIERKVQPVPVPVPVPPPIVERRAEVERQEELAEQMRVLEESQMLVKRRATKLAASDYAESQSEGKLRSVGRDKVVADLHDPQSIRRAILLREVLGPPVGLR